MSYKRKISTHVKKLILNHQLDLVIFLVEIHVNSLFVTLSKMSLGVLIHLNKGQQQDTARDLMKYI